MNRLVAILLLGSSALLAQTTIPFALRFQTGQNVATISDGGTVTLPADAIGAPVSGTLSITYRGAAGTRVAINTIDLTGSLDFVVSGYDTPPFDMVGGETVTLGIRYTPSAGNRATARLAIGYTEGRTTGSFFVNMAGVAPDFAFSYTPPGGNAQPLVSGGTIAFPQTPVDATVTAILLITNRGSGSGSLNSIALAGSAFQLVGAPLPGTVVEAGRELRVGISFTPRQVAPSTGSVSVELVDRRVSFNLEGSGASPQLTYELIRETGAVAIQPEQLISLPDAAVGEKSTVAIRVQNNGTADGRITSVTVSGAGITLSDLPPLPVTLTPGNRFSFTITFSPTAAGRVNGRLRIGADQFEVTANGLGPVLSYAYLISGVSTTVQNSGTVTFVATPVGRTSSVQFEVTNNGTASGAVSSISITSAGSVFELSEVPGLPVTLSPGVSARFTIQFAPTALGAATATLRVDAQTFTLNGTGTAPASLPDYRFEGAAAAQEPLQQPAVSLTLASPYTLTLNGTLTMAFNSDVFSNDPSVQFATGGRTVAFTIPANTTRAVFPNNATQIRLQTGTVAGTITLTPSFATEGGINLTPTRPATLNLTVASAAPRILGVSVSARTAASITILVVGYTTARSVTAMDLQFTPVSGETLATTRLTLNVDSAFLAWYQSAASQQFGSLFTATVPLSLTGETNTAASLSEAVQSISVTISNRLGTSPASSVNIH
ncbi:MAG: choice-of-anchor D domain-containing protein [Acidobacteria bacterium]|nr:choice-of-anchor D domain-containing protein [Acidobacteriota bacterium]